MVLEHLELDNNNLTFQYSLCRVVLMVQLSQHIRISHKSLSVLALSSRFDGLVHHARFSRKSTAFSTRSVESF